MSDVVARLRGDEAGRARLAFEARVLRGAAGVLLVLTLLGTAGFLQEWLPDVAARMHRRWFRWEEVYLPLGGWLLMGFLGGCSGGTLFCRRLESLETSGLRDQRVQWAGGVGLLLVWFAWGLLGPWARKWEAVAVYFMGTGSFLTARYLVSWRLLVRLQVELDTIPSGE